MAEEPKKLYRSREDRWVAGICGGLGQYFNVDATIIRIIFILFTLAGGSGVLIYLILWLIIRLEPDEMAVSMDEPAEEIEPEEQNP